jgi:acyl-coenzyme A thioesterase PaaI-like protein
VVRRGGRLIAAEGEARDASGRLIAKAEVEYSARGGYG